jgi:DNA-binding transcriptional MerR regulator
VTATDLATGPATVTTHVSDVSDVESEAAGEAASGVATVPRAPAPAVAQPAGPAAAPSLPIAEVAERTGVTAHTLRYYERIGLVDVPRDAAGRRRYGEAEVARIVFVTRLRLTAMPIRDIQAYFALVADGPGNEPERLAILERHRDQVKARLGELQSALEAVEFKIAVYGGSCTP